MDYEQPNPDSNPDNSAGNGPEQNPVSRRLEEKLGQLIADYDKHIGQLENTVATAADQIEALNEFRVKFALKHAFTALEIDYIRREIDAGDF